MAQVAASSPDPLAVLPTAKDVMKQIALKEAEKASAAMHERTAADAEKHALMEKFSKPSGVSDADRMARAAAIIKRAAAQEPYFPPGTSYHYSNTNYLILGLIIEHITGQSVGEQIESQVRSNRKW